MSSQNRVDPFQIRPESGLGGRWPIRWRPGTSVEGGTRFWPSGFRVYPIMAIALCFTSVLYPANFSMDSISSWFPPISFQTFSTALSHLVPGWGHVCELANTHYIQPLRVLLQYQADLMFLLMGGGACTTAVDV